MLSVEEFHELFRRSDPDDRAVLLEDQKKAVTRAKNIQTRAITNAQKWLNTSAISPDESNITDLNESLELVKNTLSNLETEVLKYINICPDSEINNYESDFNTRSEKAMDMRVELRNRVKNIKAVTRANQITQQRQDAENAAASQQASSSRSRPAHDLKPQPLAKDTSPIQSLENGFAILF